MIRCRLGGFALLEALVAMVIVAAVGSALFGLINTGLQSLNKAEAHVATTNIQPQILSWVRTVDLGELPVSHSAEFELTGNQFRYRAVADFQRLHGPTMASSGGGSPGIHQIALYDVTVTLYGNNRPIDQIVTRRVAHNQVMAPPQL